MSINLQNYAVAVAPQVAIAPQTIATASTVNGGNINLRAGDIGNEAGFEGVIGSIASGNVTFKLQDAPDNGSGAPGTYADVPGTTSPALTVAGVFPISIGRSKLRQWVRLVVITSGTTVTVAGTYTPFQQRQQPANGRVNGTHFIALGD
jgi:hypothetical protein